MADRPEIRDTIDISDFTAGIHAGYNSLMGAVGSEPSPDGAAQLSGTVGCVSLPNGGLAPLPREIFTKNLSLSDNATSPDYYPGGSNRGVAILDIMSFPGVRPPDFLTTVAGDASFRLPRPTLTDYTGINDFFLMVLERYYQPSGSGGNYQRQWSARYHSLFLDQSMDGFDPKYGASNPYPTIDWTGTYDSSWEPEAYDYGFGCIDMGRNGSNPVAPGQPGFCFGFGGRLNITEEDSGGESARTVRLYPEAGAINSSSSIEDPLSLVALTVSPCIVMSHQGRTVWADASNTAFVVPGGAFYEGANWIIGANSAAGITSSEELFWTKVNSSVVDNLQGTVFVEENPVGLGAWTSMNANELFLVKHQGGAVVVQGSLNNPTVVRLPGVQSTLGAVSHPVVTPLGCIYGTRSGVWVWNGSDTSTCISPTLSGHFWKPNGTEQFHPAQVTGRFAYHYPYVFVPNDWVFDIRTKGWFKLATSCVRSLAFFNTSFQGRVYGSPAFLDATSSSLDVPYLFVFDMELGCNTWSWKSQPLQKTKNRRLDFRELQITAQGAGVITVLVEGLVGDSQTVTFNVDSPTRPVSMFQQFAVSSHDVVITITSTATDPNDQAPTLYRVSLGYRTAQSVTATGSTPGT